jgi:hypothetical protein
VEVKEVSSRRTTGQNVPLNETCRLGNEPQAVTRGCDSGGQKISRVTVLFDGGDGGADTKQKAVVSTFQSLAQFIAKCEAMDWNGQAAETWLPEKATVKNEEGAP